jgi:hypothetical protein
VQIGVCQQDTVCSSDLQVRKIVASVIRIGVLLGSAPVLQTLMELLHGKDQPLRGFLLSVLSRVRGRRREIEDQFARARGSVWQQAHSRAVLRLAKAESMSIELEQIRESSANDPSAISSVCPAQQGFSYQHCLFVHQSLVLKC